MFDFLFKRRRAGTTPIPQSDGAQAAAQAAIDRAQMRQREREQALQQAAALSDEPGALAFIAACEFADARLQAAQWLQSPAALAEALRAVRNSDRRVAKLLQTRLDALQRRQRSQQQMQAVIEQAETLLRDPALTPDRVADADRAWTAAGGAAGQTADDALAAQFASIREALADRLSRQAQLQRSLIDARAGLQKILGALQAASDLADAGGDADADLAAMQETLDRMQQQIAQDRAASEAAALPKQLLPDCEHLLQACRAAHERACAPRPEQPQTIAPAPEQAGKPAATSAKRAAEKTAAEKTATTASTATPAQLPQWLDLLAQLESALEQGALQAASEAERALRGYEVRLLKPAGADLSRLAAAYATLHHLQGWARWGGNVSREELLQAALALPEQALPVSGLVQKIGSLRARWKLLSVSAGQAPQALWERFDAACTAAYAPAAALFEQQDRERRDNRVLAEALIAEAEQFAQQHANVLPAADANEANDEGNTERAEPDWKSLAQFEARMRQAWQRLGPLGHKEKRVLERAFNAALRVVQAPLRGRQKIEIAARQAMIAEVAALQAGDRQTLDTLRRIQAEWQQRAQAAPLARKDEQALWQAFRAACDAVFAQRKETAASQDAQRQEHLQQKQAVCEQLEQALRDLQSGGDGAAAQETLQQAKAAWSRTGPAPRAAERAIEQRFRDAAGALQRTLQTAQEHAAAAVLETEAALVSERLAMCFALDASLAAGGLTAQDAGTWRTRWEAAPPVPRAIEQVLTQRFETALAAIGGDSGSYLLHLQQQRASFDDSLLETEIAAGLESPPQQARQRMQLQVALLQSSLKAGATTLSGRQQLLRLCALPALTDQPTLARIGKVVRHALQC
jgi:hypothetical protein